MPLTSAGWASAPGRAPVLAWAATLSAPRMTTVPAGPCARIWNRVNVSTKQMPGADRS
jgi:hypothetical protein